MKQKFERYDFYEILDMMIFYVVSYSQRAAEIIYKDDIATLRKSIKKNLYRKRPFNDKSYIYSKIFDTNIKTAIPVILYYCYKDIINEFRSSYDADDQNKRMLNKKFIRIFKNGVFKYGHLKCSDIEITDDIANKISFILRFNDFTTIDLALYKIDEEHVETSQETKNYLIDKMKLICNFAKISNCFRFIVNKHDSNTYKLYSNYDSAKLSCIYTELYKKDDSEIKQIKKNLNNNFCEDMCMKNVSEFNLCKGESYQDTTMIKGEINDVSIKYATFIADEIYLFRGSKYAKGIVYDTVGKEHKIENIIKIMRPSNV